MDHRRSHRFSTRFVSLYAADRREGSGLIAEVSYTGARVVDASFQPGIGSLVTLHLMIQPVVPFELQGHVARLTGSGFAIHYDLFDPSIRRLVDDVAAVVSEAP